MSTAYAAAACELLEARLLLAASFGSPLSDHYLIEPNGPGLQIGIDGESDTNAPVAIAAVSAAPGLHIEVYQQNRYAQLHFVDALGNPFFGDGNILVQLYDQRSPGAVRQFVTLATNHVDPTTGALDPNGVPYYTDVRVHRVIDDFMIQTGDATNGNGTGNSKLPNVRGEYQSLLGFTGPGVLAYANAGDPNANNSQFFITEVPTTHLQNAHPIFGQVVSGWDVFDALTSTGTPGGTPTQPSFLESVEIIQAADNPEDGTITFYADASFSGTAEVTITLDDGDGGTVQKVITISSQATLAEEWINVLPAMPYAFTPTITHSDQGTVGDLFLEAINPTYDTWIAMDPDTHEITISVPAGSIVPEFEVDLYIQESGYGNDQRTLRTFTVSPAGERPTIDPIPPQFLGPAGEGTVQVHADDDTPSALIVSVSPSDPSIWAAIDPVTHVVTYRAPEGLTGMFTVTVTAREVGFNNRVEPVQQNIRVFVSEEPDPTGLGAGATDPRGGAMAAYTVGNTLYVSNGPMGLEIFDISDPANITRLGGYQTTDQTWDVEVLETELNGQPARVAFVANLLHGVTILDVTDPANIVRLGGLRTDFATIRVHVNGDLLYQADWTGGVKVWDISDPADPQILSLISEVVPGYYIQGAVACETQGNYAFVLDVNGFFFVYDMTFPFWPQYRVAFDTGGQAWDMQRQGDRLYVVDEATGLIVADISNPLNPWLAGWQPMTLTSWADVAVHGNTAAVSSGATCKFFDVSDDNGALIETYEFDSPQWGVEDPLFLDHRVVLPLGSAGFAIVDTDGLVNGESFQGSRSFDFPSGRSDTIKLSGDGVVRVHISDAEPEVFQYVMVLGPGEASSLTFTSRGGDTLVRDIDVYGSLRSLTGRNTDLLGDLTVTGKLGTLVLDDVADNHSIDIGGGLAPVQIGPRDTLTVTFDRVADTDLNTHLLPINSLTVTEWLDGDGDGSAGTITTPWINKLNVKGDKRGGRDGDFAASLALSGDGIAEGKYVLNSATIAGAITGGTWNVGGVGNVNTIRATNGTAAGWALGAAGFVNTLDARSGDLG
ncbi:MAG TPA: peptidylprolyl isomerase, partial [Phycisphaerae bacterium]|nr:peptidylprolyl isomerase [Phycisphaerae bacterium]